MSDKPRRRYTRQCTLEDLLAHLYDAELTTEVLIALQRGKCSRQVLGELYRLRRQLEILKRYISAEWHMENGSEPNDDLSDDA